MADKKELSNFHRSRLTSLTTSVVLLIVSLSPPENLKKLSLFGVEVEDINRPFIVLSLLVVAAISLLSLVLAYKNEAQDFMRERQAGVAPLDTVQFKTVLEGAISLINNASNNMDAFFTDPAGAKLLVSENTVDPAQIEQILESVGAFAAAENVSGFINNFFATRVEGVDPADLSAAISAMAFAHLEHAREQYRYYGHITVAGKNFAAATKEASISLKMATTQLRRLGGELRRYRYAGWFAQLSYALETIGIGMVIPILLFAVAVLHGFGALGFAIWAPLPEYVAYWFDGVN